VVADSVLGVVAVVFLAALVAGFLYTRRLAHDAARRLFDEDYRDERRPPIRRP